MTVILSDLELFLLNLLLLRQSSRLRHGELGRFGHDAMVGVERSGSDLIQLRTQTHARIRLYLDFDTDQKYKL